MEKSISTAEQLARIGRENELAELVYEDADVRIQLQFEAPVPAPAVPHQIDPALLAATFSPPAHPVAPAPPAPAAGSSDVSAESSKAPVGDAIVSPLAGVFYRSPNPEAPPFVSEGDQVSAGQTLCIVEAMKLMNEITAERPCKVTKILVENAEAVEEGQPLFIIE